MNLINQEDSSTTMDMAYEYLTVNTMPKALGGKQSLSCGDIVALTSPGRLSNKQRRNSKQEAEFPRFLRAKSRFLQPMDRAKSRSSSTLDDIDRQMIQIKSKLSMFREQDIKFRERLNMLSHSIEELASPSDSDSEASICSELMIPNDYASSSDDENCKDDQRIEEQIRNVSISFSSEVFSRIPIIAVTSHNTI